MKRKQLYLRDDQERALKERASELGVSEAELVRRAVDASLDNWSTTAAGSDLDDFFVAADEIAQHHSLPAGWRLDRDELHQRT